MVCSMREWLHTIHMMCRVLAREGQPLCMHQPQVLTDSYVTVVRCSRVLNSSKHRTKTTWAAAPFKLSYSTVGPVGAVRHCTFETAAPIRSSSRNSAASLSSLPRSSTDDVDAHENVGPVALAPSEMSPPLLLWLLDAAASNSGVVSSLTGGVEVELSRGMYK